MRIRIDWVNKKVKETYRAFHIQNRFDMGGVEKFLKKKLEGVNIGDWIIFQKNNIIVLSNDEFDKEFNHIDSTFLEIGENTKWD